MSTGVPILMVFAFLITAGMGFYAMVRSRTIKGDQTGDDNVGRKNMGNINIAGRSFTGNNITITNGRIIIDGHDITESDGADLKNVLEIKVTGDLVNLTSDKAVAVHGNVTGDIKAQGSVNCNDVRGSVTSGGSVNSDQVGGNVDAGGSVNCDDVGGSVNARGSIRHG